MYNVVTSDNVIECVGYKLAVDMARAHSFAYGDDVSVVNATNGHALWKSTDAPELKVYNAYSYEAWETATSGHHDPCSTSSVYIDIDGTLGKWYTDMRGYTYEEMLDPANHYFRDIEPCDAMIMLAQTLWDMGLDVNIISAADKNTIRDKWEWIREHLPFIPTENICFCPIGADKNNFVKGNAEISALIDDYNKNLNEWKGVAFKALNGVNSHQDKFPEIDLKGIERDPDFQAFTKEDLKEIREAALDVLYALDAIQPEGRSTHKKQEELLR